MWNTNYIPCYRKGPGCWKCNFNYIGESDTTTPDRYLKTKNNKKYETLLIPVKTFLPVFISKILIGYHIFNSYSVKIKGDDDKPVPFNPY